MVEDSLQWMEAWRVGVIPLMSLSLYVYPYWKTPGRGWPSIPLACIVSSKQVNIYQERLLTTQLYQNHNTKTYLALAFVFILLRWN